MLATIIHLLSKDIEVTVSPNSFMFKCGSEFKSIKTRIYLSESGGKRSLLGIGDGVIRTKPNTCIELFKPNSKKAGISQEECLEAFFRQAFYTVAKRRVFIRPKVIFKGSATLNDMLSGYHKLILSTAAKNAGARECIFEDLKA